MAIAGIIIAVGLSEYRRKRHFARTPEPSGHERRARDEKNRLYVIQKHAASRLHYDFRLETNGVLKSWAIPKGPSLDPSVKRLAVEVEDHPLEYGGFEGVIPKGEYGAGTVLIWDRGRWLPEEDVSAGLRKGVLKFRLEGEKLAGGWTLVRLKEPQNGKPNWLLIKEMDAAAKPGVDITGERPESVASQQSIDDVANKTTRVWHSNR